MYRLLRQLLFLLPPEAAHDLAILALRGLGRAPWLARRTLDTSGLAVDVAGLRFPHPVGLAAGFDKNAVAAAGLFALGFGFVEVGTVTPRAQPGNPRPRLFRLPRQRALVNRLGFNNDGAEAVAARLARLRARPAPLGVNLGKNRDTPLDEAERDYVAGAERLGPAADYLVVNASSPNTPGLRALQEPERLAALLAAVRRAAPAAPLFLKIAPDLAPEAIDAAVNVAAAHGLAGVIATNTTVERPGLAGEPRAAEAGGLSGAPLAALATAAVRRAYRRAAGRLAIIGCGGIFTAEDAYARMRAGASLVQVYTGFIYQGPRIAADLARGLRRLCERDRLGSVGEAVGRDA